MFCFCLVFFFLTLFCSIQTWVKIADGVHQDPSHSDMYGHIVWTLSQLQDKDAVWKFADWTLQRNQEVALFIFHALNYRGQSCTVKRCAAELPCTLNKLLYL